MIYIKKSESKWRKCNVCRSEKQIQIIHFEYNSYTEITVALCTECMKELSGEVSKKLESLK